MSFPIEEYAFISDCHSGALIHKSGSVDWLCFPRFDSAACFAALLGTAENGRWALHPVTDFFSHIAHINTATNVSRRIGPAGDRSRAGTR